MLTDPLIGQLSRTQEIKLLPLGESEAGAYIRPLFGSS